MTSHVTVMHFCSLRTEEKSHREVDTMNVIKWLNCRKFPFWYCFKFVFFFFFPVLLCGKLTKKSVGLDRKMSNAQAQHKNKEESRNIVSKIGGYYSISK